MRIDRERYTKFNFWAKLLVLLAILFAGVALLHPGIIPTHDGEYHVVRFYEFNKQLREGKIYPRWASDLNFGFGVPLFTFVYPFPNYVSSLLHIFGISFIDGLKLNMFLAVIIGAIFFYLWTNEFWGVSGGTIASVVYTVAPYHFVDIYIRGSVGEVWALAWYPACLWALTKVIKEKELLPVALGSIFFAAIIFSHNILALAFFPFALVYCIACMMTEKDTCLILKLLSLTFLLGLGLALVFWLPALLEVKYTVGLQVFGLDGNFPDLYQLLIPSWGADFFGTGTGTEMSVQIGVVNLLAVFFSVLTLVFLLKKRDKRGFIVAFFLICFFIIFFMMLKISSPIWNFIPLLKYFQFSWRLLSLEIVICSFLAGSIVTIARSHLLTIAICLMALFLSSSYNKPSHYFSRSDSYYVLRSNFIDGTNSPGNSFATFWMHNIDSRPKEKLLLLKSKQHIPIKKQTSTFYQFSVNISKPESFLANIAYFPGWGVFIDNKLVPVSYTKRGIITFTVPKGNHKIVLSLQNTALENVAAFGTAVSFILVITLIMKSCYIYNRKK